MIIFTPRIIFLYIFYGIFVRIEEEEEEEEEEIEEIEDFKNGG